MFFASGPEAFADVLGFSKGRDGTLRDVAASGTSLRLAVVNVCAAKQPGLSPK